MTDEENTEEKPVSVLPVARLGGNRPTAAVLGGDTGLQKADSLQPPPQNTILFVGSSSFRLWPTYNPTFQRMPLSTAASAALLCPT